MRFLALVATAALLSCSGDDLPSSPSGPRLPGSEEVFSTHVAVEVMVESRGQRLASRLLLPFRGDSLPLLAMVRGSDPWTRLDYDPFTETFVDHGIAVITWDKRRQGTFDAFAADALAVLRTGARHPRIDGTRLGLYGFSEGGWIVPLAAASAPDVAFTIVASGPAVSMGEDDAYDRLTGIDTCTPSGRTPEEIDRAMTKVRPSGFDPAPHLRALSAPGLWQFCAGDENIPVRQSIAALERIRDELGRDFTLQVFPSCNHNFIRNGAMCQEEGPRVDWPTPMLRWLDALLAR